MSTPAMADVKSEAIRLAGVVKRYPLYASPMQLAADQLGLYRLPFLRRGPFQLFTALRDVDLSVDPGERVGIVGRNGSGKTTLLKLIAGAVAPTEGRVHRAGTVQALMTAGGGFHPDLTGRQNIAAALAQTGFTGQALREAEADVADFAELGPHLDQPFAVYSLGMQARTQFAVATAIKPDILIIDEVLGAGDGYFATKSAARMSALVSSGCTLLLVSHDISQVLKYCHRVVWLRDGVIHADGPAAEITAAYQSEMDELSSAAAGSSGVAPRTSCSFALPERLDTQFVNAVVRAAEPVSGTSVLVARNSGGPVESIPGKEGLRISAVNLGSKPARATGVSVADQIDIAVTLQCTRSDRYIVAPRLLVYSLSGQRFAVTPRKPVDLGFCEVGSLHEATIRLEHLLLGAQHYILSLLVEDAQAAPAQGAVWFDLWSRCGYLSYAPTNDSDPPLVHVNGRWTYANQYTENARLAARQ